MKSDNIYQVVINELKETSLDLTEDYINMGINQLVESELIKELPIVKNLKLLYDVGSFFKHRRFIKNICVFLKEYNYENIDDEKKDKFIQQLEDKKEQYRIIDFLLLYLESIKEDEKVILFSRLFKKYVLGDIYWEQFRFLSDCLEKVYYCDLFNLMPIYKAHLLSYGASIEGVEVDLHYSSYKRLESIGLIEPLYHIETRTGSSPLKISYRLNSEGIILCEIFPCSLFLV